MSPPGYARMIYWPKVLFHSKYAAVTQTTQGSHDVTISVPSRMIKWPACSRILTKSNLASCSTALQGHGKGQEDLSWGSLTSETPSCCLYRSCVLFNLFKSSWGCSYNLFLLIHFFLLHIEIIFLDLFRINLQPAKHFIAFFSFFFFLHTKTKI